MSMRIVANHEMVKGSVSIEFVVYYNGNAMSSITRFVNLVVNSFNFRKLEYFVHYSIQSNSVFARLIRVVYIYDRSVTVNGDLSSRAVVVISNEDLSRSTFAA